MEKKKQFTHCPLCNTVGTQLGENKQILFHYYKDDKGRSSTHKWSISTGHMFNLKENENDTII